MKSFMLRFFYYYLQNGYAELKKKSRITFFFCSHFIHYIFILISVILIEIIIAYNIVTWNNKNLILIFASSLDFRRMPIYA